MSGHATAPEPHETVVGEPERESSTIVEGVAAEDKPTLDPNAPTVFNLRREHVEMLKAWPTLDDEARTAQARAFRLKVRDAGTHLEDISDRDSAQGIIDYWTATLAALPSHEGFPQLIVLAPFDESNRPNLKKMLASPFVGLDAFVAADKDRFFGRLAASEQLFARVQEQPIVVVSGPSGSGKSSLIFAGLEPKLAEQGHWRILPAFTPGNDPIAALLQPLRPANAPSDWLDVEREALAKNPKRLAALADAHGSEPVFMPIDQGEEIFTFEVDAATRQLFFDAIAALVHAERAHRIVISMRGDYLSELLNVTAIFANRDPQKVVYTIEPLTSRELQDAIVGPSKRIGLKIDQRVVEDLVREVVGEPAALPLLQFTLKRLWSKARADRITWEDYEAVGHPADALRQAAEEVWEQLSLDENREAARLIFLQLIQPGQGAESVRGGRVRRETLRKLAAADRIDRTLERFVAAGLLRRTPGSEADDDRFEVAHETLIRQWPRLVRWLEQRSRDNEETERLIASAELWRRSGDRGYLLDGDALRTASVAAVSHPQLNEYVEASRRWKNLRHKRLLAAGVVALAVLTAILIAYVFQWRYASEETARAQRASDRASAATRAGTSSEVRALIAEQTLARMLIAEPELASELPLTLRTRLEAGATPPTASWLRDAGGHDPNFLGVPVPLPRTKMPLRILDYVHFSVGYDPQLRMPRYVITNTDRLARPIQSRGNIGFATDPRLPRNSQPRAFANLAPEYGRVSLVGWREIGWAGSNVGPRIDLITASVVAPWDFYQTRWNVVRRGLTRIDATRIVYITGPLLSRTRSGQWDPAPTAFWKVAIYRDPGSETALRADAYLVPVGGAQESVGINDYRVDLRRLSRLTGLDFPIPDAAAASAVLNLTAPGG